MVRIRSGTWADAVLAWPNTEGAVRWPALHVVTQHSSFRRQSHRQNGNKRSSTKSMMRPIESQASFNAPH